MPVWQEQSRHPSVLPDPDFLNAYGDYLLFAQGAYWEAEPLYQRAVLAAERVIGPNHPHTKTFPATWEQRRASQGLPPNRGLPAQLG